MSWWRAATVVEALRRPLRERREATAAMARACVRENPALGCYTHVLAGDAAAPLVAGPLAGLAAAIKANICGVGWPNDCASRILTDYHSPFDSTAVTALREAGCGFLGLANMDEFGMGSSCEYSNYGPVRNPWNRERTAGGSSGGSAAAVAAGLAWFALGSDTGGSVRLPAHCCGIVGLKPTYGRVSRYGLVPFASSLDVIGVLARSVADARLVFRLLAGPDPRDATCAGPAWSADREEAPGAGWRLAVPRDLVGGALAPVAAKDFEHNLIRCRQLGWIVDDMDIGFAADPVRTYLVIAAAEASSNLARYDGSLYGIAPGNPDTGGDDPPYLRAVREVRSRGFGPEVQRRLMLGAYVLAAGHRDRFYHRACAARRDLAARMTAALRRYDALVLPTAAGGAWPLGAYRHDPVAMYPADRFTVPASLAGLPALTLPTGLDDEGLPLSIQLVGAARSEEKLLAMAEALEQELAFRAGKEAPWWRTD